MEDDHDSPDPRAARMRTVLAHSDHVDTSEALREILAQCEAGLRGERPRGALLYTTTEYDQPRVLAALQERWPGLPLIGASTDGEVSSALGYRSDSICLTLFVGDDLDVRAGQGLAPGRDLSGAVANALRGLGDARPALCIVHCPAVNCNASAVVREVHRQLGERACPIVGGLAGDHEVGPHSRQFFGSEAHHESLALLFLCGDLQVSWAVGSGWFPVGSRHRVTRSAGNRVFEIDGLPALEIYARFFGERVVSGLGEFPLAVNEDEASEAFYLRAALAVDETDGSVTFAGDVPQGSIVRLTEVVPEGLLEGTQESIRRAAGNWRGGRPAMALFFGCVARKWILGSRAEEEAEVLRRTMAELHLAATDLAGFYAYGEICPLRPDGPPFLHNETCVTVLVGR